MDYNEKTLSVINKNLLPLALGLVGLIFFGYGLMSLSAPKKDKHDILFEAASTSNVDSKPKEDVMVAVDVEGAVLKPGVYKLKSNSRIQDALIAAGGMNEDADREKVAKSLNLASKVIDGGKIYIPANGEDIVTSGAPSDDDVAGDSFDMINVNSATAEELESLPGIGEVTAAKIIDSRPYSNIQELLDKKVVGNSVFEKIKDKVGI